MTEFQASAVIDAINRMFASTFFSICVVDNCMKVTGATQNEDYEALRLYHCCHFASMSQEIKDRLFRITIENISNVDSFPIIRLVKKSEEIQSMITLEQKKKPLLQKLFGGKR